MKKPIVLGNWKTNKTVAESLGYMDVLIDDCEIDRYDNVDVVLTPTYMGLEAVKNFCFGSRVIIGAQNCDWHADGSFCEGYSARLLSEFCEYCFVGHSEQRLYYGNTDEQIHQALLAVMDAGMTPVLCTGEKKEAFDAGKTMEYVGRQLEIALEGVNKLSDLVVLYEPVWALGTGIHPDPELINKTMGEVKKKTEELLGRENMDSVRFVYAGSINPENAAEYFSLENVDGLAVGSASLDPHKFAEIVKAVSETA